MSIRTLYFKDVGPLTKRTIDLTDSWTGAIFRQVLFSGPNGSGKSIILRMAAMLWDAAGYWLDYRKKMPKSEPACKWLRNWGGCALVLDEVMPDSGPTGLVYGDEQWFEEIRQENPGVSWLGETSSLDKTGSSRHALLRNQAAWLSNWAEARKKLILTFENAQTANLIYLDAEERRWVIPRRNIGAPLPENSKARWLTGYKATEDWQGQLEASLITLKTSKLHLYHDLLRELNGFLHNKEIDTDIRPGENRLRVKLKNGSGQWHSLDELSAGEHQVLILLYLVKRWLERGGIVLIDEPDLHLHPSLISGFLARLESIVKKKNGQLLITSHLPELWSRYDTGGQRISLGDRS